MSTFCRHKQQIFAVVDNLVRGVQTPNMTDPVSKPKPFGDAALARRVLVAYVDGVGRPLAKEECEALGISVDSRDDDCAILSVCLDSEFVERNDYIWDKEEILARSGFSEEFIRTLFGPDNNKALQARAWWLADHFDWDSFRWGYSAVLPEL